jgi:hypothetical protein
LDVRGNSAPWEQVFSCWETKYTGIVSLVNLQLAKNGKNSMKSRKELQQELRQAILSLQGVTERQNTGIHEDAFFVGRTMFMHIHGHGHCDIRLAREDQERVLAEGKAHSHRWAPERGYVTFFVRNENDLAQAMELIQMSHDYFAGVARS